MSVYRIYSDESRQSKDRYMVLAGVIMHQSQIDEFNKTMQAYRDITNMNSELKWSKVSNNKLEHYKTFVDYFFALCDTDVLHLRSIIFDNHQMNHKKYNDGSKEVGFYKFYYQLYMLFAREYFKEKEDTTFVVHPDYRHSKYSLKEFLDILNSGFRKKIIPYGAPFSAIEPLHSHNSEVIQVLDIILGAIGYVKNGYTLLAKSSPCKIELCNYIAEKAGVRNLGHNTRWGQRRFTVWNFMLKN
ncbi:DUF3800 domain-containing protein [Flagellimonas iocasae]|uniref:DUF3800 domain-containing protein n=1 Tax=Flagellimonas iocasae TaxID=2055905 RepID=A0ABW4XYD7_9FLAO